MIAKLDRIGETWQIVSNEQIAEVYLIIDKGERCNNGVYHPVLGLIFKKKCLWLEYDNWPFEKNSCYKRVV
jgi:hypothetical protein